MRSPSPFVVLALATAGAVNGYAGMGRLLAEIKGREAVLQSRSTSLLGDLVTGVLTAVGAEIASILTGLTPAQVTGTATYTPPGPLGSAPCAADTCCVWSYVAADMAAAFTDGAQCSGLARGAIRLGFHDAGAWNVTLPAGGADGSILLSPDELARSENDGLGPVASQTLAWYHAYQPYGVGMADLIQVGALVATVVCPLGPRIRTYVGREDSAVAPPGGLLPSAFADAPSLIALFEAKSFTAADLVALVGAHSVSQQGTVDPSQPGAPQDTTDGVWDTLFYSQTSAADAPAGVVRFPSDVALAHDAATQGTWNVFAGQAGQGTWAAAYAPAYFRMSLLGVKNLNDLTDCSSVLPLPR